jgi:hypothetical protein
MPTPDEYESPRPEPADIQFDHAEFTAEAHARAHEGSSCAVCKTPIPDLYYEAGGKILCAPCRERIEAMLHGGSGLGRGLKALVLGSVAAAAGAALYYAILRITGWNIGLVSVVVGLMVGSAVRNGSGGRGGWFYQLLAVFLTYAAIAAMFLPIMLEAADHARKDREDAQAVVNKDVHRDQPEAADKQARPDADPRPKDNLAQQDREDDAEGKPKARKPPPGPAKIRRALRPNPVRQLVLAAGIIVIVLASPVIVGVYDPISGLIFGFALWEAWKINRKLRLQFNGPFRLGTGNPEAPALEGVDDEP